MNSVLATSKDCHRWTQSEKEAQCRDLEVLVPWETPTELLVLGDGYNSTVQRFGPDEQSILLEAAVVNLDRRTGKAMYLQAVARAQLGSEQVVVGLLFLLWDRSQKLDDQDAANQVKIKERQCPGALWC